MVEGQGEGRVGTDEPDWIPHCLDRGRIFPAGWLSRLSVVGFARRRWSEVVRHRALVIDYIDYTGRLIIRTMFRTPFLVAIAMGVTVLVHSDVFELGKAENHLAESVEWARVLCI